MLHDTERDAPLEWLRPILWPDGRTTLVPNPSDPGPGGASGPVWWGSPSAEGAHILIPADAPAAARRAVRRYHDGFDHGRRLKSLAAEATMAVPPVARRLLRRSRVVAVSTAGAERGVVEWLAELLDVPDLVVAVSLSVPKSNRKPVLQLLDPSGRCLGWAKVGWSPRSTELVANEASWLDRPPVGDLVVPRLLHDVELCGRRVVVTSAVEVARRSGRAPDALPGPEVFRSVADRGRRRVAPLAESPWWHSVEAVLPDATDDERRAIAAVARAADGHRFEIGAWHGDLTPWNLMTVGGRVQLIDWELAAEGAPLGFDLCHFHTQVGTEMVGADPADALDRSARLSPQGLSAVGVDPANRTLVWRLYLVELVRRTAALRADGYPTERLTHGPAALTRLLAAADRSGPARPTTDATLDEVMGR